MPSRSIYQLLRPSSLFVFLLLLYCFREVKAQQVKKTDQQVTITGRIIDAVSNTAIAYATVQVESLSAWAISDYDGKFSIRIPSGEQHLLIKSLGYKEQHVKVQAGQSGIEILMQEESLELKEIVVTASEQKLGSVSAINRMALKHTQPSSLYDALQLVPGQLAENPNLSSSQQFTIRQAPAGSAAQRMNALGTALIIDGAPISNNANLQVNQNILNSSAGSLPPFSSSAGRGNDFRQFSADNIESIEVVRGIPSARYGDLTSGAVMINTIAGVHAPRLLVRINPTLQQLSGGYGWRATTKNTFNIDADVTRAVDDPRDDLNRFARYNLQATWSLTPHEKFQFTNRFIVNSLIDQRKEDLSDNMSRRKQESEDIALRWNTNTKIAFNNLLVHTLNVTTALSYGIQKSYFQELVTRDIFPVTTAMEEGTSPGEYGRSEYLNQTTISGKPFTAYARIESLKNITNTKSGKHVWRTGTELRYEQNKGAGRQFDPRTPPRQNYRIGDRPRSYQDIPAYQQLAVYTDDTWNGLLFDKAITTVAGVRWDMLLRETQGEAPRSVTHQSFNPRINVVYQLSDALSVRSGYGMMTKMPTLSYLYPNPVYVDLVNFNYFAPNPAERLVVLTTNIIHPETDALKPYTSTKWEAGFDLSPGSGEWQIAVSAFNEVMRDAIQIIRWIKPMESHTFQAVSFPPNESPVLSQVPAAVDTFMAAYDKPVNNLLIHNNGVDFTLQSPNFENIHTSFQLTGAFIHTRSQQTDRFLDADRAVFSNQFSGRVPIYEAGQTAASMRLNTSLRIIHHIPVFRFVVSGLVQTIWIEQNRLQGYSENAVAYLNKSGDTQETTPVDAGLPELRRQVAPASLLWQKRPPMWLFNIRITKEWSTNRGFAFYINNLFNTRPIYNDNATGFQLVRNQPELFFGAELYYSF